MLFRSIAKLTEAPVEIFWLAGFVLNDRNEWKVRVVYRNKHTGDLIQAYEPIGMLPILSLGVWFDHGVLETDGLPGQMLEAVIKDVGKPDLITSADIPEDLYPLPEDRSGWQRLFRYQTTQGTMLIPAVELIRGLFIHNRALALALMRPAGIEQLYFPMEPGRYQDATIRFTKEVAKNTLSQALVMEFAWIVLDPGARRSWDSVRRLSAGHNHILFEPPSILNSTWLFRGVRHGEQLLVLELLHIGGRSVPARSLAYAHPSLTKVVRAAEAQRPSENSPNGKEVAADPACAKDEFDVSDGEEGSRSYRNAHVVNFARRRSLFENNVKVVKLERELPQKATSEANPTTKTKKPKRSQVIHVTTGERAGGAALRPLEFRLLTQIPLTRMGDLDALEETVRHMRDKLPHVAFSMNLVSLKQGKAVASVGKAPRAAMVVTILAPTRPPITLIDIERTGIVALSLMALNFRPNVSEGQIEKAIQMMLDGWVDQGGHWSVSIEETLTPLCRCMRVPKAMIPRREFTNLAELWANRLVCKLGLMIETADSAMSSVPNVRLGQSPISS